MTDVVVGVFHLEKPKTTVDPTPSSIFPKIPNPGGRKLKKKVQFDQANHVVLARRQTKLTAKRKLKKISKRRSNDNCSKKRKEEEGILSIITYKYKYIKGLCTTKLRRRKRKQCRQRTGNSTEWKRIGKEEKKERRKIKVFHDYKNNTNKNRQQQLQHNDAINRTKRIRWFGGECVLFRGPF